MRLLAILCTMLLGMMVSSVQADEIPTKKVVLRGVDKITGRIKTMQAEVGKQIVFGDLTIDVIRCYTKPPEETPENSAYLNIVENLNDGKRQEVFSGWMFSSNPALSAMEHPVYDIWVIGCKNDELPISKTHKETINETQITPPTQNTSDEHDLLLNLED